MRRRRSSYTRGDVRPAHPQSKASALDVASSGLGAIEFCAPPARSRRQPQEWATRLFQRTHDRNHPEYHPICVMRAERSQTYRRCTDSRPHDAGFAIKGEHT
jgi:hypothetical protein